MLRSPWERPYPCNPIASWSHQIGFPKSDHEDPCLMLYQEINSNESTTEFDEKKWREVREGNIPHKIQHEETSLKTIDIEMTLYLFFNVKFIINIYDYPWRKSNRNVFLYESPLEVVYARVVMPLRINALVDDNITSKDKNIEMNFCIYS